MPLRASLVWAGGFRRRHRVSRRLADAGVHQRRRKAQHAGGEKSRQVRARPRCARPLPGTFDFAGIEDLYFAAAFLPPFTAHGDLAEIPLTLTGWTIPARTPRSDGKTETEIVPQMAAGLATPGPLDLRVYVGPKSIDGLKAVRPPLNSLVQFGWWGFIAEPLFYSLRWLHHYVQQLRLGDRADHHRDQHGDVSAQSEEHARDA